MENFEQYLIGKYPDLFYKNGSGELECPCGAWVPEGWETIIDELCYAIIKYSKGTYRSERIVTSKMYYFWRTCVNMLDWSYQKFIKLFPSRNKWEYNKPVWMFFDKFRKQSFKYIAYKKIYTPAVKIDQIKEKFGELRFYYSGGDDQVAGMVTFAEYLCNKTCEVSGDKGELCSNGGWYKTLSPSVREKNAYKEYKPV